MTVTVIEVDTGEHGTRATYTRCTAGPDGGKCAACTTANARYVAERRRSPRGYVPTGPVRAHIAALQAVEDLSLAEVARRAGLSQQTVYQIATGRVKSCTLANRSLILAVFPGLLMNHISVVQDEDEPAEDEEPVYDDPLAGLRLLLGSMDELAWKSDGECARLSIPVEKRQQWFFPSRGESTRSAKAICARCPVWDRCLGFALAQNMDEGVWGRTAGADRRKLVNLGITVADLADVGMADDDTLTVGDAMKLVLAAREPVAS